MLPDASLTSPPPRPHAAVRQPPRISLAAVEKSARQRAAAPPVRQTTPRKRSGSSARRRRGNATPTTATTPTTVSSPASVAKPVAVEQLKWVCCDKCAKWRRLPSHVDDKALPEKWFCTMNVWDEAANDCSKPEIQYATTTADGGAGAPAGASRVESGASLAATPASTATPRQRPPVKRSRSRERKNSRARTGGRTRPRLSRAATETPINYKERGTPVPIIGAPQPSPRDRDDKPATQVKQTKPKVNWVMCDKCHKWRSLPGTVDTSQLPEKW